MHRKRNFIRLSIRALILLFVTSTCSDHEEVNEVGNLNPLGVEVIDPIQRDFEAIKASGVLRVITRYNSLTYFLHNGIEKGFEFDLIHDFAQKQGLNVEVVIIQEGQNPIDLLNRGDGDVIAANFAVSPIRRSYVNYSNPYNIVDQVVVLPEHLVGKYETISDMDDITLSVRKNSSYLEKVTQLKSEGVNLSIEILPDGYDTEDIMHRVAQNEYEATIADENLFEAAQTYISGIIQGPVVAKSDTIAWAIRSNAPTLKKVMDRYLQKHFRIGLDGEPKRSTFLNVLMRRYFEDQNKISTYQSISYETRYSGVLSPYDQLIRPMADSAGVDWLMVTSIMAQESKFDQYAKSWAGAVGLMQINQRFSKYSEQELYDPVINIQEGLRVIKEQMAHYDYMDSTQVWPFVLASYNAGSGHVTDARRIVMDRYKNPNEWEYVADGLLKLMKREFYSKARYGFCRGVETVGYVREVMNRYEMYKTIIMLSDQSNGTMMSANENIQ